MLQKKYLLLIAGLVLLPILGAGCPNWLKGKADPNKLTREEKNQNAEKVIFSKNDTMDIRQTLFGFGNTLNELRGSDEGVRKVTITEFTPNRDTSLTWELPVKRETSLSQAKRKEYEEKLLLPQGASGTENLVPPMPEFEIITTSGTLLGVNLQTSHVSDMPGSWQPKEVTSYEESAVWLSTDAFQELSRTGRTVLRIRTLDTPNSLLDGIRDLQNAWEKIRRTERAEAVKKETNLITKEGDIIDWPLEINGRTEYVSAFKAQHWYGDLVILNNPQNPLILKFTLDPLKADLLGTFDKDQFLQKIFGYEITKVKIKGY